MVKYLFKFLSEYFILQKLVTNCFALISYTFQKGSIFLILCTIVILCKSKNLIGAMSIGQGGKYKSFNVSGTCVHSIELLF